MAFPRKRVVRLQAIDVELDHCRPLTLQESLDRIEQWDDNVSLQSMALDCGALELLREKLSGLLNLSALRLAGTHVTSEGVGVVASIVQRSLCLSTLDLSMNDIGRQNVPALASAMQALQTSRSLESLVLSGNMLGDRCCAPMGVFLQNIPSLTTLDISDNGIGRAGIVTLCKGIVSNRTLVNLDIQKNYLGDVGALELCGVVFSKECRIRTLNMSWNGISSQGTIGVLAGLKECVGLRVLRIKGAQACGGRGSNHSGCEFGAAFLASVPHNTHLHTLDMEHCEVRDHCMLDMVEAVVVNTTLHNLQLRGLVPIRDIRTKYSLQLSGRRFRELEALMVATLIKTYGSVCEVDVTDNDEMGIGIASLVSSSLLIKSRLNIAGLFPSRTDCNLAMSGYYSRLIRCSYPRACHVSLWFLLLLFLFPVYACIVFPWCITQLILSGKRTTQQFFITRAMDDHFRMRVGLPILLLLSAYWWMPIVLVSEVSSPSGSALEMWHSSLGLVLFLCLPIILLILTRLHQDRGSLFHVRATGNYVYRLFSAGNMLVAATLVLNFVQVLAVVVSPDTLMPFSANGAGNDPDGVSSSYEFARGLQWAVFTGPDNLMPFPALATLAVLLCFVLSMLQDVLMRGAYSNMTKVPHWRKVIFVVTDTLFVFMVHALSSWLNCVEDPQGGGWLVLKRDPGVVCWEDDHASQATFLCIALIFYVVGSIALPAMTIDAYVHTSELNFSQTFKASLRAFKAVLVCVSVFVSHEVGKATCQTVLCALLGFYLVRCKWVSNLRALTVFMRFTYGLLLLVSAAMLGLALARADGGPLDDGVELGVLLGSVCIGVVVFVVYWATHRRELALRPSWDPMGVSVSQARSRLLHKQRRVTAGLAGRNCRASLSTMSNPEVSLTSLANFDMDSVSRSVPDDEKHSGARHSGRETPPLASAGLELKDIDVEMTQQFSQPLLHQEEDRVFALTKTKWTVGAVNGNWGVEFDPRLLRRSHNDAARELKREMMRSKSSRTFTRR